MVIAETLLIATAVLCVFFLLYACYHCYRWRRNMAAREPVARRPVISVISATEGLSTLPPPYEPPPVFPDEPPPAYASLAREERRHQQRLRMAPDDRRHRILHNEI
ncbi:hypothetical protein C0J52_09126 [Blattella germanica]|nr:hypothetical protein C0J52_09126 [Blattella germanica]